MAASKIEQLIHPWKPVCNADSRVLILGTFPSRRSRAEGFYYGHPQNLFWKTLAHSLRVAPLADDATIAEKKAFLFENNIALWDVLHACSIEGSSDASIRNPVPNSFVPLIAGSNIDAIFTTGRTATTLFNELAAAEAGMRAVYVPSTSPANRALQSKPSFTELWDTIGRVLRDELVTAKSMKEADRFTIDCLGVPSLTLMERAAQAVADVVLDAISAGIDPDADSHAEVTSEVSQALGLKSGAKASSGSNKKASTSHQLLCVCGTGNNGGDGLAVARLCAKQGIAASALMIGNQDKLSPDCATQLTWAREAGVPIFCNDLTVLGSFEHTEATVADALFGIGLARPLTGLYREAVNAMNQAREGGAHLLAVDIPSGISADTGEVLGATVQAHSTVTFAYNKLGLTLEPGRSAAGTLVIADIGIRSSRASKMG